VIGGVVLLMFPVATMVQGGSAGPAGSGDVPVALQEHQEALGSALDGAGFPDFSPSLQELADRSWDEVHGAEGCIDVDHAQLAACRYGAEEAQRTVAVMGDSFAVAWMPTVRAAFESQGWAVQQLTLSQCPTWALDSYVRRDGSSFPECSEHHDQVDRYVAEEQPDLVLLASSYDQVMHTTRADIQDDAVALARTGLGDTLSRLAEHGAPLAVLGTPPPHRNLVECVTRTGGPADCVSSPHDFSLQHLAGESVAAEAAGVPYVDVTEWFCVETRCPAFVDTTPVTVDGVHLTVEFARRLAPLLLQARPDEVQGEA
jgi:hypothetical protein